VSRTWAASIKQSRGALWARQGAVLTGVEQTSAYQRFGLVGQFEEPERLRQTCNHTGPRFECSLKSSLCQLHGRSKHTERFRVGALVLATSLSKWVGYPGPSRTRDHFEAGQGSMHVQFLRDALATHFDFALVPPGRCEVVSKLHP
jgi:hypothetical protein